MAPSMAALLPESHQTQCFRRQYVHLRVGVFQIGGYAAASNQRPRWTAPAV